MIALLLKDYYVNYANLNGHTSQLPFFEDERMFVSAYVELPAKTPITEQMLYRAAQLNGYDDVGQPYISSTNDDYIESFVNERDYTRWAPNYYLMISWYAILPCRTTLFYKMMLLKLSFEHSELKWAKDKVIVEELIEGITKFASRYYFSKVSVRAEGKELSQLARDVLRIDEIKATLDELYRVQEDRVNDRQNELLFLLTIFSMISGIYGMNLVIDAFNEPFDWSMLVSYTFLEWIAFILLVVGISLSFALVLNRLHVFVKGLADKRKREQQR